MTLACRFVLPLSALLATACQAPPAPVPNLDCDRPFAVEYRGEVVAAGAAARFPEAVAASTLAHSPRLVSVRTTLVEVTADVGRQLLPALFDGTLPAAAPGAGPRTVRGAHVDPQAVRAAVQALVATDRARLLSAPEVSCAEGTEAAVSTLDETSLVQRVDLVPGRNAEFAFDCGVATVPHGMWFHLAPQRAASGELRLALRLHVRELVTPVAVAATRFGRVHLPAVAIQDLRVEEPVAASDALVLGTMSGATPGCIVLAILEVNATPGTGTWTLP